VAGLPEHIEIRQEQVPIDGMTLFRPLSTLWWADGHRDVLEGDGIERWALPTHLGQQAEACRWVSWRWQNRPAALGHGNQGDRRAPQANSARTPCHN